MWEQVEWEWSVVTELMEEGLPCCTCQSKPKTKNSKTFNTNSDQKVSEDLPVLRTATLIFIYNNNNNYCYCDRQHMNKYNYNFFDYNACTELLIHS